MGVNWLLGPVCPHTQGTYGKQLKWEEDIAFVHLTVSTLVKISADDILKYFLISPKNRLWHFMQIVSTWDNMHEMSRPIFWENKLNIIHWSSAEFAHGVVMVKLLILKHCQILLSLNSLCNDENIYIKNENIKVNETSGRLSATRLKGDKSCDPYELSAPQDPFAKGSSHKGKNLLPLGAYSFLLVLTAF